MEKIWYIATIDKLEGPYSVNQLKCMAHVTPDTLVWREGMAKPLPVRQILELQVIFEDDQPLHIEPEQSPAIKPTFKSTPLTDELIIDYRATPPPLLLWMMLLLAIFLFLFLRFIYGS